MKRWENFCVWQSASQLVFEPPSSQSQTPSITIEKSDGFIRVNPDIKRPLGTPTKTIQGILGVAELPLGKAVIVISKRVKVGDIDGSAIWRMDMADIFPLNCRHPRSSVEAAAHKRSLTMLGEVLATPYFYFSATADLTNSRQRQFDHQKELGPAKTANDIWRRMDKRFLWNENLLSPFLSVGDDQSVHHFIMPVIHGAIFINRCVVKDKAFLWALISRRSRYMTGTRFFARGADSKGNVANFCETEQIVEHSGQVASYIQTRGSIPMIWEQVPNLKYKPNPVVVGNQRSSEEVFRAHFREQVNLYGDQVAVNLIDHKKAEGKMEQQFRQLFNLSPIIDQIHYEAFDFHKECSKMRYDRLALLMDQLSKYDFSCFFMRDKSGEPSTRQTGVFRTNCIDCLDRTNVVQSLLAARNLATVLHSMGILQSPSVLLLEREIAFQNIYRNAWADHANLISVQYAGTGALKTDYTRTGVRTRFGLLQDGWNAAIRYIKNNFSDGRRTDALHFFVGDVTSTDIVAAMADVQRKKESSENAFISYLPLALQIFVAMFCLSFVFTGRLSSESLAASVLAFVLAFASFYMMLQNNTQFVNFPLPIQKKK